MPRLPNLPRPVLGPVVSVALARIPRRRGQLALVALAVAGATTVIGALFGIAMATEDAAMARALGGLSVRDRAVVVTRYADDEADWSSVDTTARQGLAALEPYTSDLIRVVIFPEFFSGFATLALEEPERWVDLTEGRLPAPCTPTACEAIEVSQFPEEFEIATRVGDLELRRVGGGVLRDSFPLDLSTQFGRMLIVRGVDAVAGSPGTVETSRTAFWVAPVEPNAIRVWETDEFLERGAAARRALVRADSAFGLELPSETLTAVRAKAGAANGRLVLIGSVAVSILIAFAVFVAAIGRGDVGREYRRLMQQGALRRQLAAFVLVEALLPMALGAVAGWLLGLVAVGAIAAIARLPVGPAILAVLLRPETVVVVLATPLLAWLAVAAGLHPASARAIRPRTVAAVILPLAAVAAWDLVARGTAGDETIASRAAGPTLVLLPALLGVVIILASLVALPPILRWLARRTSSSPLAVRLTLLSLAREPHRPIAVLTLLAASLGAAVFATGYSASLARGSADQAAFETGMDIRVAEFGDGFSFGDHVLPLDRYESLGPSVETFPMLRLDAATPDGVGLGLYGLDPSGVARLRGWRPDMSDRPISELAGAIELEGDWRLRGQPVPDGEDRIEVTVDATGDPVRLSAIVERLDGQIDYLRLGDLHEGRQTLRQEVFNGRRGGTIVAFLFGQGGPAATTSGAGAGARQRATVRFVEMPGVVPEAAAVDVDLTSSQPQQLLRGPQPTDGLALPAIVSPSLAATADPDGTLVVRLGGGPETILLRVVGIARDLPTHLDPDRAFAMVALDPLSVAVNTLLPGRGVPNEVLLRTADAAATSRALTALDHPPFHPSTVLVRERIENERGADPFALGIAWALALAAAAGLLLSATGLLAGAAADLRDDRGELAELEAQGVGPTILRRMSLWRPIALAVVGTLLGVCVGVVLVVLVAASIAVSADAGRPIPALAAVTPWPAIIALAVGLVASVASVVVILVARRFRDPRAWR